ncbi:YciI family protein [Lysobacter korlensis]|uniref:YciI family protein n=1 Tax=Lysobacter korlensis TaxID=553636 RepID=A0ABV6RSW8_9GAMM
MTWYLLRLFAARPDFAFTMTEAEQATMGRHADYWRRHLDDGTALIFSPVADPAGPWGLCIAQAQDRDAAQTLTDADPAVTEGVGRYEILELFSPVLR